MHKRVIQILVVLGLLAAMTACGGSSANGHPFPPPSGGSSPYLFASSEGKVWSYTIDATTGALGSGRSVDGPAVSAGILVDPAGKFLYVSDGDNDTVDVYSISSSGTLTPSGSPYTVGTASNQLSAAGMAMDSAGKFLYVTDIYNNTVVAFSVNGSTGALTSIASPYPANTAPAQAIVDASGKYLYVSNSSNGSGGVSTFSINGSTGALTPVLAAFPFITVGSGAIGLATHGSFLYTTAVDLDEVFAMSIDSSSGSLTSVVGSPFAAGTGPEGVVLDPTGKFLYTANQNDNTISAYGTDSSTGALTALSGSPVTAGDAPFFLATDPTGKFLYVGNRGTNNNDGTIGGYSIDSTAGGLTAFSGSPVAAGNATTVLTTAMISN